MKKKSLIIKNFSGDDVEVFMEVSSYQNNGQIAILLYEKETGEYYSDLSVNVKDFDNKLYMAVDTNNFPYGEEFIKKYNLGTLVDYVHSGFCEYPVYEMDLHELEKYDPEGVHKFIKDNGIEKHKNVFDRLKSK